MTGHMVPGAGGQIHTRVDGPEGAPWMVLSNSLGANLTMWDAQMPLLTRAFRVVRYDTRGHGLSETVATPFDFDDLVADVIAVMDAYDIDRAAYMGLSLGGMTGLGVALAHPDRINRLICADARAVATDPVRQMWDTRISVVANQGLEAILDGTMESWFTADWRADHDDKARAVHEMILGTDPVGYVGCCHALKTLDYFKQLAGLSVPTLYLVGDQDKGAPPEDMRAMAEATPGAVFTVIPDAGHLANMNAPAAFNHAVAEFLAIPAEGRG